MTPDLKCSFCDKTQSDAKKLISSPSDKAPRAYICDECIEVCKSILNDDEASAASSLSNPARLLGLRYNPTDIYKGLSEVVVGQHSAKKSIAIAVYKHLKRIAYAENSEWLPKKDNVLLVGPTGAGKTLLVKTLARFLGLPLSFSDATTLSEAGYVGDDVDSVLVGILRVCGGDLRLAKHGIIVIDRIDKIGRKAANGSITRDVSGEGVQQALLAMLEGAVVRFDPDHSRKHPHGSRTEINTQHILFICVGAFEGIEKVVARRLGSSIGESEHQGYCSAPRWDELRSKLTHDDLVEFGLLPEFVSRFTTIATLSALSTEDLIEVMTRPATGLLRDYRWQLEAEGVDLHLEPGAVEAIARNAESIGGGVRSLQFLIDRVLGDATFSIPGNKRIRRCVVTREAVELLKPPLFLDEHGLPLVVSNG